MPLKIISSTAIFLHIGSYKKGETVLPQILQTIKNILPENSLLLQESFFTILLVLPTAPISAIFLLKLAMVSISADMPRRQLLIWGTIIGLVFSLFRMTIPIPFHILFNIIFFCFFIWRVAKITLTRAIIATLFSESVVITGSIFVLEPIILLLSKNNPDILHSPLGFAIGATAETFILLVVISIFKKRKLSLLKPDNYSE